MALRSLRLLTWLVVWGMLAGSFPKPAPVAAQPNVVQPRAPERSVLPAPVVDIPTAPAAPFVDPHLPSLTIHLMVAPDPVPVGETAAFTLTVANQAPDPATKVVVTLPTPDGALAEPGDGVINPAKGWQWTLDQVAALSEVQFTGVVRLVRMPSGDALLFRPEVTAAELSQPVASFGGALVWDRAKGSVQSSFAPGKATALQGENGRLTVTFPANAARAALGLQYRTLELARADLLGQHRPVPPTIANVKRALAPVVLDATDAAGAAVHQFDAPLTLAWRYTQEQLLARGISAADLTVFWFDETLGQWVPVPSTVDEQTQTVSTVVDHFSAFTLGDGSSPSDAYLPSLKGWQVSDFTGAVSYNYPIDVPAGPGGLKPPVSLNYSSAATDGGTGVRFDQQAGLIGKGWSLDFGSVGVRKVVRDASTANIVKTYTLTINGQSYDVERGSARVGSPNPNTPSDWNWYTTDESFLKIYATPNGASTDHDASVAVNQMYDFATSVHGRGGFLNGTPQPRYTWHIWAKDGMHYEYDEDLWSGMDRCAAALEYDFEPYKWLLSRVTDTFGNTITYSYDRQVYVGAQWTCGSNRTMRGTVDRDAWPKAITWANNHYRVLFQVTTRGGDTAFDGPDNQYLGVNGQPRDTKQLTTIEVQSSSNGTTWNRMRQYRLSQDFTLYSDQRVCSGSTCTPNTTYPKLTLKELQQYGSDDTLALPKLTFTYETNGGTGGVAAGGWQRLKTVNNSQGGTATFVYENIQAVTGNNVFNNRHRVTSKTLTDGRGNTATWSYTYGTPAMNSLGTLVAADMLSSNPYKAIYAQGPNTHPNSAILYLNLYTGPSYRYDTWLAQPPTKEFRGHDWVQEVDPSGGVTKHFFYQGDVGCFPQDVDGTPLNGETAIKNNACFQAMRDREFLKGREYETRLLASATATNPLQKTLHSFGVAFFDYGTERLSGLWHAFAYEKQTDVQLLNGTTNSVTHTTKTFYNINCAADDATTINASVGNVACTQEFEGAALVRKTVRWYLTTNTASSYLLDRMWQEAVYDSAGYLLALTNQFYDSAASANTAPTKGELTRVSRYYDIPANLTATTGITLHGSDTTMTYYDAVGDPLAGNLKNQTTYTGSSTRLFNGTTTTWGAVNGTARTTTTTYKPYTNLPTQETNPAGHITTADYDNETKELIRVTGPNSSGGTPTNCAASSFSIPATEETTCAVYDKVGRLVKLVKPGDSTTSPTLLAIYDTVSIPFRYILHTKDSSSDGVHVQVQFYDGLGREIQVKNESDDGSAAIISTVTDTRYDKLSRVAAQGRPFYRTEASYDFQYTAPGATLNNATTTTYDALGRPLTVVTPNTSGTRTTSYSYGVEGTPLRSYVQVTDPLSHATRTRSDALGRRVQVVEDAGPTTTYAYDALDELISVTDAAGNVTTIDYDSAGRKTSMHDPDMGTWSYSYNPTGTLASQTDAKNQTIAFSYDALDRLTSKTLPGGWVSTYTYDDTTAPNKGKGHRTAIATILNNVTQTYKRWEYDARGRTTLVGQNPAGVTTDLIYTYDAADRVSTLQYYEAGETVTYTYDKGGRPASLCSSIAGQACYVSGATYTADNQPDGWTDGNNVPQDWIYEATTERLNRLKIGSGTTASFFDRTYSYDAADNITSITDNKNAANTQSFGYDTRDRLTCWKLNSTSCTASYGYTAIGNLTSKTGVGTYGYPTSGVGSVRPHAPSTVGGAAYTYDNNGNLLSGGGRSYTWTAENLPATITTSSGTESYTYDADGERVVRTAGGVTTVSFEGLWEQTTAGARKLYYTFNGAVVAVRDSSSGLSYLHADHLGSVSLATTTSGTLASQQEFDPWGAVRAGSVGQTSLNYTGQKLDGTGLLYYHTRMYDPVLARFVSADSVVPGSASGGMDGIALKPLTVDFHEVGFGATLNSENGQPFWFQLSDQQRQQVGDPWGPQNPQSLNRYSYVLNGPMRYNDPSGHVYKHIRLDATKQDAIGHTELDRFTKGLNDRYNEFYIIGGGIAGGAWVAPPAGAALTLIAAATLVDTNRTIGMLQNAQSFLNKHGGGYVDFTVDDDGTISVEAYSEDGYFYGQYYAATEAGEEFIGRYVEDFMQDNLPVDHKVGSR